MKPTFYSLILFLLIGNAISAQQVTDVNKHIDKLKVYEKVVEDGFGTAAVYTELANGYYFESDYRKAKKWFELLFETDQDSKENQQLKRRYRQTLKALEVRSKESALIKAAASQQSSSLKADNNGGK
jgi:hypothetical protein